MSSDETPSASRRDALDGAVGVGAIESQTDDPAVETDPIRASEAGDRVVVGFESDVDPRLAIQHADQVYREFDFGDVGRAVAGTFAPDAIRALQRDAGVRYVEVDGEYRVVAESVPWGVDRIDADVAHGNGYDGSGANIAILDTGIDGDHPDLESNVGTGRAFVECGAVTDCPNGASTNGNACVRPWSDDNDHGTHCAGIAAAAANSTDVVGVASGATLHAVKVLNSCGGGSLADVAAGVQYVADQGWDVASMSFGSPSHHQTLADACQYAHEQGVLLVAAAGNTGPCTDCVHHPAADPRVIAVSATDRDDTFAEYSSSGPEVDLAAPGTVVESTVPPASSGDGTAPSTGTSMAAPHVAGASGVLMANGLSNVDAQAVLQSTAEDLGLPAAEQGDGLLDVEAATNALDGSDDAVLAIGRLDTLYWADNADCGFQWRAVGASSWNETPLVTRRDPGPFSQPIEGLATDTEYECRAVAYGSNGISDTGGRISFTPSDLAVRS